MDKDSFKYYSLDNDPTYKLPNSFRVEVKIYDTFLDVTLYVAEGLWAKTSLNCRIYSKDNDESDVSLMNIKNLVRFFVFNSL